MQFTVDIPNPLITQAETAAARIDARRPADLRSTIPLKLDSGQARDIVINHLISLILTDDQEQANINAHLAQRAKAAALEAHRQTPA